MIPVLETLKALAVFDLKPNMDWVISYPEMLQDPSDKLNTTALQGSALYDNSHLLFGQEWCIPAFTRRFVGRKDISNEMLILKLFLDLRIQEIAQTVPNFGGRDVLFSDVRLASVA